MRLSRKKSTFFENIPPGTLKFTQTEESFPSMPRYPILESNKINTEVTQVSSGGTEAAERQGGNNLTHIGDPAFDTADFGEENSGGPGNLRCVVLGSEVRLRIGGPIYD